MRNVTIANLFATDISGILLVSICAQQYLLAPSIVIILDSSFVWLIHYAKNTYSSLLVHDYRCQNGACVCAACTDTFWAWIHPYDATLFFIFFFCKKSTYLSAVLLSCKNSSISSLCKSIILFNLQILLTILYIPTITNHYLLQYQYQLSQSHWYCLTGT